MFHDNGNGFLKLLWMAIYVIITSPLFITILVLSLIAGGFRFGYNKGVESVTSEVQPTHQCYVIDERTSTLSKQGCTLPRKK